MARNTDFVILGMLELAPMSGYEIRQEVKQSINAFWSESDGQLYPALKRLLANQEIYLVEEKAGSTLDEKGDNPRGKKVYGITPAGRARFKRWLAQPVSKDSVRSEFCLKMFFGASAEGEIIKDMIEGERLRLRQLVTRFEYAYQEIEAYPDVNYQLYWRATVKYGEYITQAKLKWCDETLDLLKNK